MAAEARELLRQRARPRAGRRVAEPARAPRAGAPAAAGAPRGALSDSELAVLRLLPERRSPTARSASSCTSRSTPSRRTCAASTPSSAAPRASRRSAGRASSGCSEKARTVPRRRRSVTRENPCNGALSWRTPAAFRTPSQGEPFPLMPRLCPGTRRRVCSPPPPARRPSGHPSPSQRAHRQRRAKLDRAPDGTLPRRRLRHRRHGLHDAGGRQGAVALSGTSARCAVNSGSDSVTAFAIPRAGFSLGNRPAASRRSA